MSWLGLCVHGRAVNNTQWLGSDLEARQGPHERSLGLSPGLCAWVRALKTGSVFVFTVLSDFLLPFPAAGHGGARAFWGLDDREGPLPNIVVRLSIRRPAEAVKVPGPQFTDLRSGVITDPPPETW